MIEDIGTRLQVGDTSALSVLTYTFIAGFLTSLTPCVYPLIPITLSIFGGDEQVRLRYRFVRAIAYCAGIAATYTALGVISARTGMLFGSFLAHPLITSSIALLMFVMALTMLDIFQIPGLTGIQKRACSVRGAALHNIFGMGAVSGLVAAPCVSPVLAGVLVIAASGQNLFWGGTLLFVYAMGIGCIFIFLATFASFIHKIPRSGNWLFAIKFIIASALCMVSIWLIAPLLPPFSRASIAAIPIGATLAGACVALLLALSAYRHDRSGVKVAAAVLLALCLFILSSETPAPASQTGHVENPASWYSSSAAALSAGAAQNKITMIDIFADWCAACKELEKHTFPDPAVMQELSKMVAARVDYASEEALVGKFEVFGLPCILFIAPDGSELPQSRIDGFVAPDVFAEHLRTLNREFAARVKPPAVSID